MFRKISYYLPQKVLTNSEIEQSSNEFDSAKFEKKVGISERRVVEKESALDLAQKACEKLFQQISSEEINFILMCTQSPEYFLPTTACMLQERLGLPTSIGALDFNLGCSGYVYGLSLAKGLISSGVANNVLFVTTDTYSKFLHKEDYTNRAIFGDGASATLVDKEFSDKIGGVVLGTDGSGYDKLIVKNGAGAAPVCTTPVQNQYAGDSVTDDNHLYMNGPDVFNFTIDRVPAVVEDCLNKNEMDLGEVDYFVFHQANAYMLKLLRKLCGIPEEKFILNFGKSGNTVSSTIPIALTELSKEQSIEGKKIMLVGFGVGLSWGATIVEF